jgi:predicted O-methyltransferase YrrM
MSIRSRVLNAVAPSIMWSARRVVGTFGFSLTRRSYYSPIPEESDLPPGYWDQTSELVGIDMNDAHSLELLRSGVAPYLAEFRERFPIEAPPDGKGFWLINGVYMAVDAHVYYSLIRHFKPRRIIEIGSGQSTLLAVAAAAANRHKDAAPCEITAIEPYPARNMQEVVSQITLIEKPLQAVALDLFQSLGSGDILFIDSTHVLREGNDVQLEYLEILPRLKPGVLVHVHDISLPRRYPRVYFEKGLYWNEQYLLQAFLAFNSRFEVIWGGNHLFLKHPQVMKDVFPEIATMRSHFPLAEPSSFWMRVRG